jgi:glycosyltransferase involved in cell wall biosynthesis
MRVLQLGPYPPPYGGVQTNLVALRQYLLQRQIPCAVINITRFRKTEGEGIYYPSNAARLIGMLFRLHYDIVHLHFGGILTPRVVRLALVCASVPGKRSVLTFHSGGFPSMPQGKALSAKSFPAFVFRRFDALIGVNQEIIDFFIRLGAEKERVHLIPPHAFTNEQLPQTLPEPLASFFQTHQPILISAGQLEPEYNLPLQIDVMNLVLRKYPTAGLVLAGSGSNEKELRAQIRQSSAADHILLCGDVPHDALMKAVSESRIMLRTTLYDGDSISVREALRFGTAVIATDNGMRPPGVHLLPTANPAALAAAIDEELGKPSGPPPTVTKPVEGNLQAVLDLYYRLLGKTNTPETQSNPR